MELLTRCEDCIQDCDPVYAAVCRTRLFVAERFSSATEVEASGLLDAAEKVTNFGDQEYLELLGALGCSLSRDEIINNINVLVIKDSNAE